MATYKFTDDFLDLLKEQADIVGIIGDHVKLKRTGGSWRGISFQPSTMLYAAGCHCFRSWMSVRTPRR